MEVNRDRLDKIGVVGCGAVGGFYGAKLCRAGRHVHFLLRSDYGSIRKNGLRIRSGDGDFCVHPTAAREPGEIGPCDLVIVALKSTANHRLGELLPPLVGKHTALLTLQNGLDNETALAALFPNRPVFGGMCFVCINRTEPGVIHHIAHGKIVLGRHGGSPDALTESIAKLIRSSGIPVDVSPDLERTHWEKLIWNIPFNGLGVAGAHVEVHPVQRLGPGLESLRHPGDGRDHIFGEMTRIHIPHRVVEFHPAFPCAVYM